jgi:hypothetical protein
MKHNKLEMSNHLALNLPITPIIGRISSNTNSNLVNSPSISDPNQQQSPIVSSNKLKLYVRWHESSSPRVIVFFFFFFFFF